MKILEIIYNIAQMHGSICQTKPDFLWLVR